MIDAVVWLMGCPAIKSVSAVMGQNHKYELGDAVASGMLTGKVSNAASFDPEEMDVEDFASGCIKLENGGSITFKTAWAANLPECTEIRISGTKAGICLPEGKVYTGSNTEVCLDAEDMEYAHPFAGHFYIIDSLREALSGKKPPLVCEQETLTVAAILEMCYLSAKEGREVTFCEISE